MGGETIYRIKTSLAISGTQTQVFADSVPIGASALNYSIIVCARVYYLVAVAVCVIVVKADFSHLVCK